MWLPCTILCKEPSFSVQPFYSLAIDSSASVSWDPTWASFLPGELPLTSDHLLYSEKWTLTTTDDYKIGVFIPLPHKSHKTGKSSHLCLILWFFSCNIKVGKVVLLAGPSLRVDSGVMTTMLELVGRRGLRARVYPLSVWGGDKCCRVWPWLDLHSSVNG